MISDFLLMIYSLAKCITSSWICSQIEKQKVETRLTPVFCQTPLCVSSEAAYVMRAGLSVGEEEQPSPSNRLHAALF
jgi:hypothetical protein